MANDQDNTLDDNQQDDSDDAIAKLMQDPKAKAALKGVFKEISEQFEKADEIRGTIKDILDSAADRFNVKAPLLRKAARMYYKRDAAKFNDEVSAIKDLYTTAVS